MIRISGKESGGESKIEKIAEDLAEVTCKARSADSEIEVKTKSKESHKSAAHCGTKKE